MRPIRYAIILFLGLFSSILIYQYKSFPRPPPITLNFDGESTLRHRPELGTLSFAVKATHPSQTHVSDLVTTTSNTLHQLLQSLSSPPSNSSIALAPLTTYSTGSIHTSSRLPWRDHGEADESERLYSASISFSATFRDLDTAADIAGQVSGMPNVEIGSLYWKLSDETTARLKVGARKDAMRDAVKKAGDVAAVVGREVVPVEVAERDVKDYGYGRDDWYGAEGGVVLMDSGGKGGHGSLKLEPGDLAVQAKLSVKFIG